VIDFDFSWGKEKSRQTFCVALGQVKMNFPLTIPSTFQQRKRKPKKEADSEGKSLIKTNDWQLVFTVMARPICLALPLWLELMGVAHSPRAQCEIC